jgi:ADP-heptose:LPS heptosyltransferase
MKNLLAINFGGIGDEILFLPTLHSIRTHRPDWRITLLLEPRSGSVIELTDLVDAVETFNIKKSPLYPQDLMHLLGLIRGGGYDAVISSGSSPLVAALLFMSGIPVRVGYDSGPIARLLLTGPVQLERNQYAAFMYHDLVSGLGINCQPELPAIKVAAESRLRMQQYLAEQGGYTTGDDARRPAEGSKATKKRIVMHPGTSKLAIEKGIDKTWSPRCWAELIDRLAKKEDLEVILAGGPDDREIVAEISALASSKQFVNAFGHTRSLSDLAALTELADLLVCVDSAPMHIAVALGRPVLAMFGPTEEAKLLPADKRFRALRGPGTSPDKDAFRRPAARRRHRLPAAAGTGVQLQPETVFQAVLDQLYAGSSPGSSREFRL